MKEIVMDIQQIMDIIPHRYPFLLIDRVVELEDNHRIVAIKNVSVNEPFFQGHFPGRPVMPGALVLEALAQAGAILAKKSSKGVAAHKNLYLVGATNFRWKRQIVPGDTLRITMVGSKLRPPLWVMEGDVYVGDELAVKGTIQAMEVE